MPQRSFSKILAGLLVLFVSGACTTSTPPSSVRIVSQTDIVPPPEPANNVTAEPANDITVEPAPPPPPPAIEGTLLEGSAIDNLERVGELLETVDESTSTSDALAQAIEWTAEGLRAYDQGDRAAAYESLSDARIILLEAELPEAMQERGLMAIHCVLPEDLRHHDPESVVHELELAEQASGDSDDARHAYIESEVRRILRAFGSSAPGDEYLDVFVQEVEQYIRFYQGKHREFFERAYERKHKYWPTIEAVFGARGIPVEMGYMALVESGFNPRARSRANARGLWQFIPSTGRRYQLRRVDDFYDVVKATEAASEYLLDLIGIFGSRSFLLAMAAYNTGEGRIQRCLRGLDDPFGGRSFWAIRDCLARETREYVPRIMAATVIGRDPRRFGFDLETAEEKLDRYDVVAVPSPTSLATLASRTGVSVAELRTANTDLASNATSTPVRNFPLYLPKGRGETLVASLQATPRAAAPPPASSPPAPARPPVPAGEMSGAPFEYEVQAGDTLAEIAQGFGVSVGELRRWNPFLRQRVLYKGDRLKVYSASGSLQQVTYRVRRGDTLSEIATRHGVSLRDLARWNQLRSPYRLQVGQQLALYSPGDAPRELVYTVRRGNTLQAIANIFSVRYRDVMKWNGLRSSTLQVGQKLVIRPPHAVRVESYRVRRGDTVARIARRFGVKVTDVLTANGLGSRTLIRPGQRLVVYVR